MKKIISVLLLTMYIVSNFAFTVSAEINVSHTENLFGVEYYNCDTVTEGVGVQGTSGSDAFEESLETGTDAYDGASIKLTGKHRNLFEKTVTENLLGNTVKVSLKLKSSGAATTDLTKQVRFYYKVLYTQDGTPGALSNHYFATTNNVTTSWDDYSVIFDIDDVLTEGQTFAGISFWARIGNNLSGIASGTAAWIDRISLNVLPEATAVESINRVDADGMTEEVELLLDSAYVDANGLADMAVDFAGTPLTKDTDYTASVQDSEGGKKKVVIEFTPSKLIKTLTVSGIKDIWGRNVDCTNATLSISRDSTTALGLVAVDGEDLKLAGVDVMLNTPNVDDDCLADMEIEVDGASYEGSYEANVVDSTAGRKKVAITFEGGSGIYAKEVAVSGIKDLWNEPVDCTNATISIPRDATTVTKLVKTPVSDSDERASSIDVILDTPYLDNDGIENMILRFDGDAAPTDTYTKDIVISHDSETGDAFAKIVITLNTPKLLNTVAVSGIKDLWDDNVDTENAVLEEARATTKVLRLEKIPSETTEGLHSGIKVVLNTPYVSAAGLSNIILKINGNILTNDAYTPSFDEVTTNGIATKNIIFTLTSEVAIESAVVVGIKDEWNRALNEDAAIIKAAPTKATYSENLLGVEYTAFENNSLNASDFTAVLDSGEKISGAGSLKFSGYNAYARDMINKSIPMTLNEAPDKLKVSFYVKASEDIKLSIGGAHPEGGAEGTPTFTRMRVFIFGHFRKIDGTVVNHELVSPEIDIKDDYADWQYASVIVAPDYTHPVDGSLPEGAILTDISVRIALCQGQNTTRIEEGYIWIDEVKATMVPGDDEFPTTAVTENPSTPVNGEQNAESDKVVFLYDGPIEAGLIPQTAVVIKEGDTADSLKVVEKTVTFNAIYDPVTGISQVEVIPDGGFRNSKYYEVELNQAYDVWARETQGTHRVRFKVKDRLAVDKAEGESTVILKDGSGKVTGANVNVRNNDASSAKNVVLVIAVCNGDNILDYKISESKSVAPNDDEDVSATFADPIEVNAAAGDYVRAFLWDSTIDHRPLAKIITE